MDRIIKIGHLEINLKAVNGITEKAFLELFEPHYKRIGKDRRKKMKEDYKELKKHFNKGKKAED